MDKRTAPNATPRGHGRRLIIPLVLAVSVVGTIAGLSSGAGCTDHKPTVDAGRDGAPDTPIV